MGLSEFHFGASLLEGVVGQGCDRAWRVECIMGLKKIAGSPILDNENAVFFVFQNLILGSLPFKDFHRFTSATTPPNGGQRFSLRSSNKIFNIQENKVKLRHAHFPKLDFR